MNDHKLLNWQVANPCDYLDAVRVEAFWQKI